MNPKVDDFPALIHWIAEKYHGGAVHPIHEKVGISPALVQLWSKGGVKNPNIENLDRLCQAYRLDFNFVRGLLRRPKRAASAGYYVKRTLRWLGWTPYRRRRPCLQPQVALAA